MRRFPIPISILLFITLACSVTSTETPTQTILPPGAASSTPLPTDKPVPLQALVEKAATELPFPVPAASPQPAVARHQPGDAIVLDSLTMIDAQNGWSVSGADVLFTADGARTWREVTPPETLTPGSQVQAHGIFLDDDHAWIVFSIDHQIPANAVVWRTEDSGSTWTASAPLGHQVFGEQVWAEFFGLDETHLWLTMRGVYLGAGTHYVGQLLRSIDGGLTWLPLAGNENFDYNYDYSSLIFADANHGLATWLTMGAYAPGPPEYALTSNGGGSWEAHQLPPPTGELDPFYTFSYCEPFQAYMFSARSIRLAVGCLNGSDVPRAFLSYLYSSEDGGATWTSLHLPEKIRTDQDTLFFFDPDNILLLDRDIFRSTDGGQNWDFVKSVAWEGQFSFVDPQTGWAIARADAETALVKTSNGGATWTEIKPVIAP